MESTTLKYGEFLFIATDTLEYRKGIINSKPIEKPRVVVEGEMITINAIRKISPNCLNYRTLSLYGLVAYTELPENYFEANEPAKDVIQNSYALVDNISGDVVATRQTLESLKDCYQSLKQDAQFQDMTALVYEIAGKKLANKVSVDWENEPIQNGYEVENFEFGKAYEFGAYGVLYFVQRISDRTIFVTDEKPASKDVSGWNLYL